MPNAVRDYGLFNGIKISAAPPISFSAALLEGSGHRSDTKNYWQGFVQRNTPAFIRAAFMVRSAIAFIVAFVSLGVDGATYEFMTSAGSLVSGNAVSASATFETSSDQKHLIITLNNLLSNPTSVGQVVTGISFDAPGLTGGSLSMASGQLIRISSTKKDGTTWTNVSGRPAWYLTTSGNTESISVFGHGQPHNGLIGAPDLKGMYSKANSSIAGNEPHNPFYQQTLAFDLAFSTPKLYTSFDHVRFLFGTTPSFVDAQQIQPVPEPASYAMLVAGLGLIVFVARRRVRALRPVR